MYSHPSPGRSRPGYSEKPFSFFFLRGGSRCTQARFRKNVPQGVRHFLLSCQKFSPTGWGIDPLLFIGVERTGGAVNLGIPVQSFLGKRMCSCWFCFSCLDRLDLMYFTFSILITFALGWHERSKWQSRARNHLAHGMHRYIIIMIYITIIHRSEVIEHKNDSF